jgi:hypothetical protein
VSSLSSFHPVLRIYSNAPVASASTSTASATGSTFEHQEQHHPQQNQSVKRRGSPRIKTPSTPESRPRKTSTESLRRHIASQHSPTTSEGSRTTGRRCVIVRHRLAPSQADADALLSRGRSSSSPRMYMRSSSSSSSSSLSSLAGLDLPAYAGGLGLNLKPAVPLPPAVDNGVAFPSMESVEPSIPIGLSPAHSTDSLRSCIKEGRSYNYSQSNGPPLQSCPILEEESPTTRKRRSVSFATEEPIVHHLHSSTNGGGSDSESSGAVADEPSSSSSTRLEQESIVQIPSPGRTVSRPRRMSGILPDRFIGMDTAGSLYSYIRTNALSTFSSRTSLSSEASDSQSDDHRQAYTDPSWLRLFVETILGLSLAMGWLAVGRVVGTTPPRSRQQRLRNDSDETEDVRAIE